MIHLYISLQGKELPITEAPKPTTLCTWYYTCNNT